MPIIESDRSDYQIEGLIRTAFRIAQDQGKPDWYQMTVAVLKNRLLQITKGAFHERNYDALSFRKLLARYPHLIEVHDSTVALVQREEGVGVEDASDAGRRVRADLWRAVMDYSSGKRYAWDAALDTARVATPDDVQVLPTISSLEMDAWRAEFVVKHGNKPLIERWRAERLGTKGLPQDLQGPWNLFLRDQVAIRLSQWFEAHKLKNPGLVAVKPAATGEPEGLAALRRLVITCVSVMTMAELKELRLSPDVVLRSRS